MSARLSFLLLLVLVLPASGDDAAAPARLPRAALVELLSVHVVLDYIDAAKIAALPRGRPTVSTTLFQTTGNVCRRTRFLAITPTAKGGAVFASAVLSALVNATLKRVVAAVPYNIFVLHISNFVVPPSVLTRPRPALPPSPPLPRDKG
uniref:FAS1 domain-containing protein n=1 Tax=Oryza nivara TaxID=4536 RepID=A0A0E0G6N3_ORYNI